MEHYKSKKTETLLCAMEVVKGFSHDDDCYDVLTDEDLKDIEIAEKEFAKGRTGSWKNIK